MTNYCETTICEIADLEFQSLVSELCHCINLGREEFDSQPLSFLLMAIGKEQRTLTHLHLPVSGILTTKVNKLLPDSVVYCVCRELANLKRTHIESFDGKTVLSLIKRCHKAFCPQPTRPKSLTRRQRNYHFGTELIKQRRRNGDL